VRKLFFALLLFLGFSLPLPPPSEAGRSDEGERLDVLFTNDVQGYIEPCG